MSDELYKKFRPKTLEQLIGQPDTVRLIESWGERIPQALLISGPSGCGKTTVARILARRVGCKTSSNSSDFSEKNCADFRGIDTVREIRYRARFHPVGKSMAWLIDECHKMTNDAQNAILKLLEDTPPKCYFFLATTDPLKLIKPVQNRCTKIRVRELGAKELLELLKQVSAAESLHPTDEVLQTIIQMADGSARAALVLLNSIIGIDDPKKQRDAILKADVQTEAFAIARALMDPRTTWPDMQKLLQAADIEDPEPVRRMVLAYCSSALLKSWKPRAAMIIDYFQKPWYDCGKSGLLLAVFEIMRTK